MVVGYYENQRVLERLIVQVKSFHYCDSPHYLPPVKLASMTFLEGERAGYEEVDSHRDRVGAGLGDITIRC
jgi:hypothetical protein